MAEAGLAGMFGSVAGLSGGSAVALTFVIRLATLWFAAVLGILGLFIVRFMLGAEVSAEAPPEEADAVSPKS